MGPGQPGAHASRVDPERLARAVLPVAGTAAAVLEQGQVASERTAPLQLAAVDDAGHKPARPAGGLVLVEGPVEHPARACKSAGRGETTTCSPAARQAHSGEIARSGRPARELAEPPL